MIDFHSHILPHIDDGSEDVTESLALLASLREQGVDCVCATPHYIPSHHDSPQRFLERRQRAMDQLALALREDDPRIVLGAEVAYFEGISHMKELPLLRLGSSKLVLIEMPFAPWSVVAVRELTQLACSGTVVPLLAHVERYLAFQKPSVLKTLLEHEVLMQINASFLLERGTRHTALKMLKEGKVHLLGSDCHNVTTRPPRIKEATDLIRKKLGENTMERIDSMGYYLLREKRSRASET